MDESGYTGEIVVLLIQSDDGNRQQLERFLVDHHFRVVVLEKAEDALSLLEKELVSIIVSDDTLPGMDGLELLREVRSRGFSSPFILVTAFGDVETAVQSMKMGAFHFLEKPVPPGRLLEIINKACEKECLLNEVSLLRRQLDKRFGLENLIGKTPQMQKIFETIRLAAPTNSTILITGESGTGKELVARAIHQNSLRKNNPFVALNAAALPENLVESELFGHKRGAFTGATADRKGYFEAAVGGTLLIDEIGDLPFGTQAKLLRALEDRIITRLGETAEIPVDIRIITSTNRLLENMVRNREFREDLYYRLTVLHIILPPLRERRDDIPLLIRFFLRKIAKVHERPVPDITAPAIELLKQYAWPGNVRELMNVLESIFILNPGTTIDISHLPATVRFNRPALTAGGMTVEFDHSCSSFSLVGKSMAEIEKEAILETLKACKGNKTEAARMLQIGVRTIHRKIHEYGLEFNGNQ